MKAKAGVFLGMVAIACGLTVAGCGKKPEPGLAERAGAKLDQVAKKGAEKAEVVAEKAKDIAKKTAEKVGETVDKDDEKTQK